MDTLGWRLKLGVLIPSTNTSVQPEYDAMRPHGVTNHVRAFRIPNVPTQTDTQFRQQQENMRATMVDAMGSTTKSTASGDYSPSSSHGNGRVAAARSPRYERRRSLV